MNGANGHDAEVWMLTVNCTVFGALDGRMERRWRSFDANVRTYGSFFLV